MVQNYSEGGGHFDPNDNRDCCHKPNFFDNTFDNI